MAEPDSRFVHTINVTWGDCDPALIVYTGRLPWMALDAINAWWEDLLDGDGMFQMEIDRGYGTPFVNLSMDFRSPVTPRHPLRLHTRPVKLGTKSITFRVDGYQDGVLCFEGRFTSVFIVAGKFTSRPAPDEIRSLVEPLLEADE